MQLIHAYKKIMGAVNRALFWVMGILLIFMSLMLFYDVIARYFFSAQTSFGYDLNLWLTIVLAFLGGGYALQTKEHIVVDAAYAHFPSRMKAAVNIVSGVAILFLSYVLIKYGMMQVMTYYSRGSVAMSGFNIPIWIKWSIVPIGGVFLGLQGILYEIENIYAAVTGREMDVSSEKEGN